jgi:hypothetical protein
MKKLIAITQILIALGCSQEEFPVCITGTCNGKMVISNLSPDANGYYHVQLSWGQYYYPRFDLYVEASKVVERCQYNKVSVVEATFDTNTYWVMGDY